MDNGELRRRVAVLLKSLLDWLNRKRIIHCPICNQELNVYAYGSKESLTLLCVPCNEFYLKSSSTSVIVKYEIPEGLMKQFEMDPYHKYYTGLPVSEAYEPRWIKYIRNLLS